MSEGIPEGAHQGEGWIGARGGSGQQAQADQAPQKMERQVNAGVATCRLHARQAQQGSLQALGIARQQASDQAAKRARSTALVACYILLYSS